MSNLDEKIQLIEEPATELESLQFFQTQEHPCSYLENQSATTIFLNPQQSLSSLLYAQLSDFGFRRSGKHIYKPMCSNCQACIPMRIPATAFKASRSQKRVWKRNQDLSVSLVKTVDTDEHYALYERYIRERHADGDMFPPSPEQFRSFLVTRCSATRYYEFRLNKKLIACSVADMMDNGLSAVYTYFAPEYQQRSLGTYVILFLIDQAQRLQLPSVYLGYWIKGAAKMHYKSAFRPLEILSGNRWLRTL